MCEIRKRHLPKKVGRLTLLRLSKTAIGMDMAFWQMFWNNGAVILVRGRRVGSRRMSSGYG